MGVKYGLSIRGKDVHYKCPKTKGFRKYSNLRKMSGKCNILHNVRLCYEGFLVYINDAASGKTDENNYFGVEFM
jgi:hypothetical protein